MSRIEQLKTKFESVNNLSKFDFAKYKLSEIDEFLDPDIAAHKVALVEINKFKTGNFYAVSNATGWSDNSSFSARVEKGMTNLVKNANNYEVFKGNIKKLNGDTVFYGEVHDLSGRKANVVVVSDDEGIFVYADSPIDLSVFFQEGNTTIDAWTGDELR